MKKMQDSSTTETKKTLKSYQFTKINMKMRSIHYQKLKKKNGHRFNDARTHLKFINREL